LSRPIAHAGVYLFCSLVVAVDGQKFCFDSLAINSRGGIAIDTRHRPAAKRSVDVDGPASANLRAGADRTQHGHIAVGKNNRLTGADRAFEQQRRRLRLGVRLLRFILLDHAVAAVSKGGMLVVM